MGKKSRMEKKVLAKLLEKVLFTMLLAPSIVLAENTKDNFQNENPTALENIHVTALKPGQAYPGGLINRDGLTGILGYVNYMDNPYNVTSYTSKAIQNQQSRNIGDFINKYDASINTSGNDSAQKEYVMIRGFMADVDDANLNGLIGLAGYFKLPSNGIESVEVIKGPSTMLTGVTISGSASGNINLRTKKAQNEPITEVGLSYYSRSRYGLSTDLGYRFGPDNMWGIRYNGAFRQGDGVRERQKEKVVLNTLVFDYRGERLRASLDGIVNNQDFNGANGSFMNTATRGGVGVNGLMPAAPSGKTNFDHQWTQQKIHNRIIMARVEWDITDDLMAYGAAGTAKHQFMALNKVIIPVSKVENPAAEIGSYTHLMAADADNNRRATSVELGLTGKFELGPTKHKWYLGANSSQFKDIIISDFYALPANCSLLNIYNVGACDQFSGNPFMKVNRISKGRVSSVAFADTMSFWQDKINLSLGLRYQSISSKGELNGRVDPSSKKTAISPSVGLLISPIKNLSFYTNYIEGMSKGLIVPIGSKNFGEQLDPYKTKQIELGVKKSFGSWLASAGVFSIEKATSLLDGETLIFSSSGRQKNTGLELNIFGEAVEGLRFTGSATWIDAKRTKYNKNLVASQKSLPVAKFTGKANIEWDIPKTDKLTVLTTLTHTSKIQIDGHDLYSNALVATKIPAWSRVDVGLIWSSKQLLGKNTTIQANVENVFNKRYWAVAGEDGMSGVNHAQPRTFLLSVKAKF